MSEGATPGHAFSSPRSRNERRILSLIRHSGGLPKADLARLCNLSPTAVGAIIRQLEGDGLVEREAPQRGKIGQPAVPYVIAPEGAFTLGLKVGRRSAELVLLDALMRVVDIAEQAYRYPDIDKIYEFAAAEARRMIAPGERRQRLVGLGVAAPSEIWCWADDLGAPAETLDRWRNADLAEMFGASIDASTIVVNDATAACAAQLALDPAMRRMDDRRPLDFVYFFVGWFIGGGVVIGGRVF